MNRDHDRRRSRLGLLLSLALVAMSFTACDSDKTGRGLNTGQPSPQFNVNGVAVAGAPLDGATVRATLALIFAVGVVLTVGARALAGRITGLDLGLGALSVPMVLLGFWASRFLTARVEGRPLRVAILGISALAALGLLGRAVAT